MPRLKDWNENDLNVEQKKVYIWEKNMSTLLGTLASRQEGGTANF